MKTKKIFCFFFINFFFSFSPFLVFSDFQSSSLLLQLDEENKEVKVTVTSSALQEVKIEEVFYLSLLLENKSEDSVLFELAFELPQGWNLISDAHLTGYLLPYSSQVKIFGVKVSQQALSGIYDLKIFEKQKEKDRVKIKVLDNQKFNVSISPLCKFYERETPISLELKCHNESNHPLTIEIQATGDPFCELIYFKSPLLFSPYHSLCIPFKVISYASLEEQKQFVLLKIINSKTSEILYQEPISLNFTQENFLEEDEYERIATHLSFMTFKDKKQVVQAVEYAGEGVINFKRQRYLDFHFLLPTTNQTSRYQTDQRLFLSVFEPQWKIDLGDTVYHLSPLTQNVRYGRGAGVEGRSNYWSLGTHYTQNPYFSDYNPKETCAYLCYDVSPNSYLAVNYLYKKLSCVPSNHLVTLQSEVNFPLLGRVELEIGKNFNSLVKGSQTNAYRLYSEGGDGKNLNFVIEKIHAGPAFFGYYQNTDVFSSYVDFPTNYWIKNYLSCTFLTQKYTRFYPYKNNVLAPKQSQYNWSTIYYLKSDTAINLNALLLKAHDAGWTHQYNFYQKWLGASLTWSKFKYNFYITATFGHQKNYQKTSSSTFLQKYYAYFTKDLTRKLSISLFYEGGNTNYYDAKPWRTTFGGSINYRYSNKGTATFFAQKVNNKVDKLQLLQTSFSLNYTFKNGHFLETDVQYFHYKSHYRNDLMFFISYTVPFSQRTNKKIHRGKVEGYVYDTWSKTPVPSALVSIEGGQVCTNSEGYFLFPLIESGEKSIKVDYLPENLITQRLSFSPFEVKDNQCQQVNLYVLPDASIKGKIILSRLPEQALIAYFENQKELVEEENLSGIKVILTKKDSQEVYTSLSDADGEFEFLNLRPGCWQMTLETKSLPLLTYFNQNNFTLDLKPNDRINVAIKALPEKREIQTLKDVRSKL